MCRHLAKCPESKLGPLASYTIVLLKCTGYEKRNASQEWGTAADNLITHFHGTATNFLGMCHGRFRFVSVYLLALLFSNLGGRRLLGVRQFTDIVLILIPIGDQRHLLQITDFAVNDNYVVNSMIKGWVAYYSWTVWNCNL